MECFRKASDLAFYQMSMNEKIFQFYAISSAFSSRQRVDQPEHIVEYVVGSSLAQELEDLGVVHRSCFFVNLECGQLYTLLSFSSCTTHQ